MDKRISHLENLSRAEKRALLEQMQKRCGGSQSIHSLSYGQRALWHMQRLMPESPAYNVSTGWRILSELNITALHRTFQWLVDRHASLRTTYTIQGQEPIQIIHPHQKVYFRVHEVSDWNDDEFHNQLNSEAYHIFDLEKGPLMRANLYLRRPGDHILLISCHHIAMDLWSLTLLFQDIRLLYPAAVAGKQPPPWPSRTGYIDFVHWQEKMLAGPDGKRLWQYWRKQLDVDFQNLDLPIDFPRSTFQTFEGAMYPFRLGRDLTRRLQELAQGKQTTLHTILLAGIQALLYRYSNQTDFLIGSLAVGRSRAEFERTVGFFVNPVMLRANFDNNPTFNDVLDRVQQTVAEAIEHQDFPFSLLIEKLRPGREMNRNPLSDVMFILQTPHRFISERKGQDNVPQFGIFTPGKTGTRVDLGGLIVEIYNPEQRVTQNDLAIEMVEAGGELSGAIHYRTDLFRPDTIVRLANHYKQLLECAVEDAEQSVSGLTYLSESERYQLLHEWNDTQVRYSPIECIHQLFEGQVEKTPDSTALLYKEKSLTYCELNTQANRVARFLRSLDVGPETLVCISLKRSPNLVIAMLGVLKAGGAFVPIEASYPPERLRYMLKDAHPKIILTENHLESAFRDAECPVVCLDSNWEMISNFNGNNLECPFRGNTLAYVIYTSGSTGWPKGVMIEHRSVVNMIHSFNQSYMTGSGDRVMQQTSISFDVAIGEIFPILSSGGTLCLPTCEDLEDLEKRLHYIDRYQITIMGAVPSLLAQFNQRADQLSSVRLILSGGEALSMSDIDKLLQVATVTNGYGPTETTVCSTFYKIKNPSESTIPIAENQISDDRKTVINKIPIGKPIANTRVYILDNQMQPVPVGIPGEIYIGGAGLSRGYLNRPEQTTERFIPNPFATDCERLYQTGDLARYLPNGEIVFLGRVDSQVKIRGFRVETEEIEIKLCQHPLVEKACVLTISLGGHPDRLIAYIVPHEETPGTDRLVAFLKERLPNYMIPSFFIFKESLPLTPSGKIDRNALSLETDLKMVSDTKYVAPRNQIEEMVAEIWAEVLGLEQIGVHDDFFNLGGHSLLATQIISRLRNAFKVELPLRVLFESPNVSDLSIRIQIALQTVQSLQLPPIQPTSRDQDLPLSFAQQRLWFIDQLMPSSPIYNIPYTVRIRGMLNLAALGQSLNEVVKRHESLRTTFPVVSSGQPVQKINSELKLALPVLDLRDLSEADRESEVRRLATEEAQRPFNLARGPLVRTSIARLGEEDHVVLLTLHHIISDGWSTMVFVQEMAALYQGFSTGKPLQLPELPIQYADFAVWQRQWLQGEVLKTQLEYWKKQLGNRISKLELPTDRPQAITQSFKGATHSFILPKNLSVALKTLSRQEEVTLFITLLAAFKTLLYRYTGQEDITVGSPIANRNRAEIEGLIGFFVNTLVMRTDLSGNPTFREVLGRVREVCLGAYAHQDLPFEKLVEILQPRRDMSYAPLVQVAFAFQNVPFPEKELPGLTITPLQLDHVMTQLDLTLLIGEGPEGLTGFLVYKTDLFDAVTIKRMGEHFRTLLESIVTDPEQPISRLPLLTEEERSQLLVRWNDTKEEFPREKCIHQLFESQVARTPDSVAVVFSSGDSDHNGEEKLTYRELNRRANQLAHYLQELGIGPEVLVGICVEPSLEMVVGILGILKAGGAYLPLDPAYPKERLSYMLQEAQVPVLLTQERLAADLPEHDSKVVCFDSDWQVICQESNENPESGATAQNLAYLIYTSGSTGRPKGVLIEHRSVVNVITSFIRGYNLDAEDRILQQASISFDVSVNEIFPILCAGGTLILSNKEEILDFEKLICLISKHNVTIIGATPSLLARLNTLKHGLPKVRLILSGGEALSLSDIDKLLASATVTNGYGPTETTVCASCYELNRQDFHSGTTIPIGKPLMNYQLYILSKDLECMPVGCPGELFIGGIGLARGYLNDPELSSEKFIPNPFKPGERLFRTGDLARWLPDGNIEFLGRIDRQLKIRGLRIEPGEIETVLSEHPAIQEAAVLDWEDSHGDKRLVAYLVPDERHTFPIRQLLRFEREGLLADLPRYELPNGMVVIHQNEGETEFSYKEIFEHQFHLGPGITLNEGDCIFDVGANIGLFTLFMSQRCKNAVIYSFEPIPPIFEKLRINTALYGIDVKLFQCGLADISKREEFIYFPQATAMSGRFTNGIEMENREREVRAAIKEYVQRKAGEHKVGALSEELVKNLLPEQITIERFTCQLKTISDVIRENQVERIDLLKIDAEKSELDVLAGIKEDDWPKIRQIVVEVQADDGQLEQITGLLQRHGYHIEVCQKRFFQPSSIVITNVYAVRSQQSRTHLDDIYIKPTVATRPTWNSPSCLLRDVRQFMKEKLPDYMIPSTFVPLERLPLTPGGKVDRTALPVPDGSRPDLAQEYVPPRNPIQKEVAKIWAEVLGLDKVGIYDNFFELGGHSLLATQLIVQVRDSFQVDLPLLSVFEAQTVAGFADVIDTVRREGPAAVRADTDLNAEAVLDPTICPKAKPDKHVSKPASILLTGATGFLGTLLLNELLEQTQADIYCLIRSPNNKEGKKKLQRSLESYSLWDERLESRIIPVAGDLSKPLLGLSTEQFKMLAAKIDIIYHNGALVNFVYPYSALKATNVLGTQEVLRLASQIKVKPVHYISTLSVFSSDRYSRGGVIQEQDSIDYTEGLYGGYAQSKWVAEKLVKVAGSRGLPFCIYRPGMITGHSQTGICNTDELICKIIQGCIQLGSAPDIEMMVGMTPVDYVSRAIVYLSMQQESRGNVFHLVNPHPVPWSRIVDWIRSFGYSLQKSSTDKWLSELSNLAGHSLEKALYPLLTLFNENTLPRYECQNTLKGLAGASIVCPAIDAALLKTYFSYFVRSGFLDVPQPRGDLEFPSEETTEVISQ